MKLRIKGNEVCSVGPGGEVRLVYKLDSLRECAEVSHRGSSLRIVGFSDWRVQDIGGLIQFLESQERPDSILYAGDDIGRFRPPYGNLFEELAGLSRYGLCAVAGNDDAPSAKELISGHNVYPVHSRALVLGEFAVVGVEGAPLFANDDQHRNKGSLLYAERFLSCLMRKWDALKDKSLIVVSHAPPFGVLDFAVRFGPRSIGSRPLREFLEASRNVVLCVCGHVHRCGGKAPSWVERSW
jgi:Calcineurin-like phosphoesterase